LALLAAALLVAALATLAVRDFWAVLVALAALSLAGGSAWVAVTRRGAIRISGLVVAVAALAAAVVVLVRANAVDELVVVAVAAALFTAASRAAVRRGYQADVAELHVPARAQPHARRAGVLLMNPKSGGGKVERFDLVEECKRRGIEPVVLRPGDDLRALALEAASSAEVIGMAGGDGSQAIVAQVAMEKGIDYVCIPAGTRNHLALDLGLDRDDVVGALDAFGSGIQRPVDLAFVNGQIFVNNVSLGIYAEIVQSDGYREAKRDTFLDQAPELLGPDAKPFDLRFRTPDGEERRSAQLVLVSNNPYVLDRLGGMGSRPRLDTGKLGVVAVSIDGPKAAAELAALDAIGQVHRFPGWLEWAAEEFEVESGAPVAAGIDGEAARLTPPLRFKTAAAALAVRLPPRAALSPAAATPGLRRSTFRGLWDVAAGRAPER
jgi:diacylglycerol kinase family enzyme